MDLCLEGPKSYSKRLELFKNQKEIVEEEIKHMNKVLDMIKFKCWYYEQAIRFGNEEDVVDMIPEKLPSEIKDSYKNSHE